MIRTNYQLLSYIEHYYQSGAGKEDVHLKTFQPGERIIQQGTTLYHVFVIRDGITKCYITEENGKDYIVEFLGIGEVLGELEQIRKTSSLTNIEALTGVTAYRITQDAFSQLLKKDQAFNQLILEELATRIAQTAVRAAAQQIYPVEYAILKLLSLLKEQHIIFSKQDMADYLAISLRSFNRIIRQLRDKDILDTGSLSIDLTPQALKKLLRTFED